MRILPGWVEYTVFTFKINNIYYNLYFLEVPRVYNLYIWELQIDFTLSI